MASPRHNMLTVTCSSNLAIRIHGLYVANLDAASGVQGSWHSEYPQFRTRHYRMALSQVGYRIFHDHVLTWYNVRKMLCLSSPLQKPTLEYCGNLCVAVVVEIWIGTRNRRGPSHALAASILLGNKWDLKTGPHCVFYR